jgi:S-methylmethionine-dependent homocysteine/selenocysteine methylase
LADLAETLKTFEKRGSFAVADAGMGALLATQHKLGGVLSRLGWAGPYLVPEGPPAIEAVHRQVMPLINFGVVNTYRAGEEHVRDALIKAGDPAPSPTEVSRQTGNIVNMAFEAFDRAGRTTQISEPLVVAASMGTVFNTSDAAQAEGASDDYLVEQHTRTAKRLAEHRPHVLLGETIGSRNEAVAIKKAADETGVLVVIALNPDPKDGSLLYSRRHSIAEVAQELAESDPPPVVIGANCSSTERVTEALVAMEDVLPPTIPRIAYANGYPPEART